MALAACCASAIAPGSVLQRLALDAVAPYIDRDVLARQLAREEAQRRALTAVLNGRRAGGAPS
ncbi:hypothetical protein JHN54_05275 [Streptomyces sp. MBT70]|nr:hypothetical protein [Streptomyces sp. MBT70]